MPMPVEIEPRDLGLPSHFPTWRPGQLPALYTVAHSTQRFIGGCMPTGFGKSMWAIACALLFGVRVCVITSTKILQQQYLTDFESCGMVDIRGNQNYHCPMDKNISCAEGKLMGCKSPTCEKSLALAAAKAAQLVITNYPCYLHSYVNGEGLGEFGMLILDEGHTIVDELCDFLEIEFTPGKYECLYNQLNLTSVPRGTDPAEWRKWAAKLAPVTKALLDTLKQSRANIAELKEADRLYADLNRITLIGDDWILHSFDKAGLWTYTFSPLWPTAYAEMLLFRKVPKVLLLSATIVRKTLDLLGIPVADSILLDRIPGFNPDQAPVYLFGPSKIDYRSPEWALAEQAGRMDMLISKRLDRKGLGHTISYDRQKDVVRRSLYREYIMAPDSRDLAREVETFRQSPAPRLLFSPAITTGYDFKYTQAEYQFILKLLFVDARTPAMKARATADPDFLPYLTSQNFQQTCGRIVRAPDDQGETVVLDAHANWFIKKHRPLFTQEFLRRVRYSDGPPQPPPALSAQNLNLERTTV